MNTSLYRFDTTNHPFALGRNVAYLNSNNFNATTSGYGSDDDTDVLTAPDTDVLEDTGTDLEAKCILYNDDWHTFEEVTEQIMKATGCTYDKAEAHTHEVHFKGMSIVFTGDFMRCLRVSDVLEEIKLRTQVEC
jgi:ATP-dependent Clp protease adaptor protein ClpS